MTHANERPDPPGGGWALVGAGWERIQFTIGLCDRAAALAVPPRVRLRAIAGAGDAAHVIVPVATTLSGDRADARFNVMQGPGVQPMAQGTWRLEVAGSDDRWRPFPLRDERPDRGDLPTATFKLTEGTLSFVPSLEADGRLAMRVDLDRSQRRRDRRTRSPVKRIERRARALIRPLRRVIFRGVFAAARATRRRGTPVVLFTSHSNHRLTGNLKLVHDRMVERGIDARVEFRMLFHPPPGRHRTLGERFRLPVAFARADAIVLDDFYPLIYEVEFDPRVKVVQLWHASGAFKTVGYSRVGRPGSPSPYGRAHKNYTHAIVSSHYEVRHYAEAFGIPESRVYPTGVPRMDRFFDEAARAAGRARTLEAFPGALGRMTILFAPTFRGHGRRGATYDMKRIDMDALHAVCVAKDACVIFRMHPFVRRRVPIPEKYADRLFDGSGHGIDINDLLPASDLLITDYSSTVFEFAALGRPMLFYAYDLESYISRRGFYTPYPEFVPGRIVRTFAELVDAIAREDYQAEKVAAFAARHLDHVDGRSTDRVIDLILGD